MTRDPLSWRLAGGRVLVLDRARIMGVLNVTPDSFSDGGRFVTPHEAISAALEMLDAGADMIDVGGESTRPGAQRAPPAEQIARVVPVVKGVLRLRRGALISVDTTSASVALAALDAGACAINDVSSGTDDDDMLPLAAKSGAGIVLMHRLCPPEADSYSHQYARSPDYGPKCADGLEPVVRVVRDALRERMAQAIEAGVSRDAIVLDPGLGFGKSVSQNYALLRATAEFVTLRRPVLGAASRKSFIGLVSGVASPSERVAGSVAASVAQRLGGATLFRVHDVRAHAEALRVADSIMAPAPEEPPRGDTRPAFRWPR